MNWVQALHGLQFDDDALLHQQVDDELAANALALVVERQSPFDLHPKAATAQSQDETFSIDRFEQSRSKSLMHFDGTANDGFG